MAIAGAVIAVQSPAGPPEEIFCLEVGQFRAAKGSISKRRYHANRRSHVVRELVPLAIAMLAR
jgi:hypothetical protein